MLQHLLDNPQAMVDVGMRLGKTLSTLAYIAKMGFERVLVVTLPVGIGVWKDEIEEHTNEDFLPFVGLTGPVRKRWEKWRKGDPGVYVTNSEGVWRDPLGTELLKRPPDCVIYDESQRIAKPGSRVSRHAHRLARRVPYRDCLTGTMMHNSPLDLYGQFRFLNEDVFGTNYNDFLGEYAVTTPGPSAHVHIVRGFKNQDKMAERIAPYTVSVTAEDTGLSMPDELHTTRNFDLPSKARTTYKQLQRDFIAAFARDSVWDQTMHGDEVIAPKNVLERLVRFQQLSSGFVKTEDGNIISIHGAKIKALMETLEETNEPVVVVYSFKEEARHIHHALDKAGERAGEFSGQEDDLDDWKAGAHRILLVQAQKGNAAIDLSRSRHLLFYSTPWSPGDFRQIIARIKGPKQTARKVDITYLVGRDTQGEVMIGALRAKQNLIDVVKAATRDVIERRV